MVSSAIAALPKIARISQMNKLTGTWKNSASRRACFLPISRLPFSTSDATLLDPKTEMSSRIRQTFLFGGYPGK